MENKTKNTYWNQKALHWRIVAVVVDMGLDVMTVSRAFQSRVPNLCGIMYDFNNFYFVAAEHKVPEWSQSFYKSVLSTHCGFRVRFFVKSN